MKQSEKTRLENNWSYAQNLWKSKQKEFKLECWMLHQSPMDNKIGVCDYNHKMIFLSSVFLKGSSCNYARVKKALMHEIAHAITPGHAHDHVWKEACARIGGDTRLSATMSQPGMNWAMYCSTCKWRNEYLHKPNIAGKVCIECHNYIKVKQIK